MKIDVIMAARQVEKEKMVGKTAIVLDIFRATTSIVTAFDNQCAEAYPVYSIKQAWEKSKMLGSGYVLGGERRAVKIKGFDLGNSPQEYIKDKVCGKKVIITTTNGTKAIERSKLAQKLIIGSFLNAGAVSRFAIAQNHDITVVCAGTEGELSLEDVCCAGLIIDNIAFQNDVFLTDAAICARETYVSNRDKLNAILSQTKHYNTLIRNGFADDIDYCLKTDITGTVPVYDNGKIILGE